ncbi:MAG: TIR domain-containing protein [Candidatus Solibacter sp.]
MTNILFVASNATAIQFDFAKELERLQAAREHAGGTFSLISRWSVSADELHRLLEEHEPNVVHVLSPGVNLANRALMLDRGGQVEYVSPAAFAGIFDLHRTKAPSLVVLNTCHSLKHAEAIAPRVGAVVAMKGVIYDSAAIEFAAEFYESLAFGSSVTDAFEQGRQAVARVAPEQSDQPVLVTGMADPSNITIAPLTPKHQPYNVEAVSASRTRPAKLFCSYSHADERFRSQLEKHLALLSQQDAIHVWHDRRIEPGTEWKREIDENLEEADIVLLLISADFMASQYCMGIEMKRALEKQHGGSARVVPILIRLCDLEGAPFAGLQWLPTGSKPVSKWSDRDEAWTNVAKGIRTVVASLTEGTMRRHLTR